MQTTTQTGFRRLSTALLGRCQGPGGCYNLGNLIGLASGVGFSIWGARQLGGSSLASVWQYFLGDPGATALTLAVILFLIGGELYHRAFVTAPSPQESDRLLRMADFTSGVAGLLLSIALIWFGDYVMALLSTVLLAGGKFGNALSRNGQWQVRLETVGISGTPVRLGFDAFRVAVPLSRLPAIAGLAAEILRALSEPAFSSGTGQSLILLVCYLLWLRADSLLLLNSADPAPEEMAEPA